jgi:hypothetical protein
MIFRQRLVSCFSLTLHPPLTWPVIRCLALNSAGQDMVWGRGDSSTQQIKEHALPPAQGHTLPSDENGNGTSGNKSMTRFVCAKCFRSVDNKVKARISHSFRFILFAGFPAAIETTETTQRKSVWSVLYFVTGIVLVAKTTADLTNNQNNVCKIWGFHGGDYEEYRLMGCGAV